MEQPANLLSRDGEVYLYSGIFNEQESAALYEDLIKNIAWKQEPIIIAGREIMQPRLTAWYGDPQKRYSYSGITMHPHLWTSELLAIKYRIEQIAGYTFTSALLNYYRDGNDSVGWHRDNEKELGINPVIGSVSFGTTRTFQLRHAKDKSLKESVLLNSGSFLLMRGSTQHHWFHSIPKEVKITQARINITFRNIIT
ncbi:alpha-ketoglutarate-dependent dioxygenase AlkB [Mucilaginibacter sp. cycad4]|uniref:alpha-ketoglutarate-dependent dioxygenase AlkB family protein n=1 Tax=Mucilaginibacter sp. cycad4 TaxID=3342096 RepID=UPI002AAB2274|nr:alpha-ketoglutarate-dependent dioxygenase AlkB [Mucilaginibacter gossypii]WPV02116.1 alpha-ketoglutarate-dependent dioxygenase AlkB [Mucilaginibacter gossypii]